MAVGAYSAYNLAVRVPQLNFLVIIVLAGRIAAVVGVLFGLPSLRRSGPVPRRGDAGGAVLHRLGVRPREMVHQLLALGSVSTAPVSCSAGPWTRPMEKYLFVLVIVIVFALAWPRTWCAATSAARGWRCATWTSPPR